MKTKKLTYSSLLVALGVLTGSIIYIPVGVSKCFPIQHLINVIAAVILGPVYGVMIAFCISLLRNILGTGSILAFPGSMIGALLAGVLYKYTKKNIMAVVGEIIGTGILGALVAYPIATYLMGKEASLFFMIIPFSLSTIGGSIIAYVILSILYRLNILNRNNKEGR
ncbi:MAG: energy coupling factor transporter S component ThiW [Clostridiaceae bacterium]